ncbi:SAM-dependent methyltransferase [Burkholderia singularis]|nr:class I SAM-dependent methyltransferase [Burkholderia singularis]
MEHANAQRGASAHHSMNSGMLPIRCLRGDAVNDYESKIETTYQGDPEEWRKAIGDYLLFQFGVYDDPRSTPPISLDEAGIRYFERQLNLAGFDDPDHPDVERILDIGCGWGYILKYLAERFPNCMRLDGINVSREQLEYCARFHAKHGLADRVNLYQCNAQDVHLLPDHAAPYDLVIIRGVISHFPNELYEKSMHALHGRVRPGGMVVISDNLYNVDLDEYTSDTPDEVDRIACKHRKTAKYFVQVLTDAGFKMRDMRVLPSNIDVARWLMDSKANIEKHFPHGATGALEELRVLAENWSVALIKNKVSTYSVIVTRPIG